MCESGRCVWAAEIWYGCSLWVFCVEGLEMNPFTLDSLQGFSHWGYKVLVQESHKVLVWHKKDCEGKQHFINSLINADKCCFIFCVLFLHLERPQMIFFNRLSSFGCEGCFFLSPSYCLPGETVLIVRSCLWLVPNQGGIICSFYCVSFQRSGVLSD